MRIIRIIEGENLMYKGNDREWRMTNLCVRENENERRKKHLHVGEIMRNIEMGKRLEKWEKYVCEMEEREWESKIILVFFFFNRKSEIILVREGMMEKILSLREDEKKTNLRESENFMV